MHTYQTEQRGLALPVMLIMLVVMMISSVYLLKASTTTTLTSANLAYESSLSKAVDLGLLTGTQWLNDTAVANKALLDADSAANAYLSTFNTAQTHASAAFWNGSKSFTDSAGNTIEYVVHRMCAFTGPYSASGPPANTCMQTSANTATLNNSVALGGSLSSDAPQLASAPLIHYIVTARISGARGGNVINQAVVVIGA